MMTRSWAAGSLFLWNEAEREDGETGGDATVLPEPELVPEAARTPVAVS